MTFSKIIVGNNDVTTSRSVAYSASLENSWTWSFSWEMGMELEYDVGLPLIGGQKTKVSLKTSATRSNSATSTTTVSDTASQVVTTKMGYKDAFYVMGTKYVANMPFTSTIVTIYTDNTTTTAQTTGFFSGQSVNNT